MRVVLGRMRYRGQAIDLAECCVSAAAAVRAVRRPSAVAANACGRSTDERIDGDEQIVPRRLRVDCSAPDRLHREIGRLDPQLDLNFRAALAAAARSWGVNVPQDEQLRTVRERLDAIEVPTVETDAARRAVANAGADERRLRERVAQLRGRVETLREVAPDSQRLAEAEDELAERVTALSEAETERMAAQQRLARAERDARRARDARERRLRLQDREENLKREIRAVLAERAYPTFVDAAVECRHRSGDCDHPDLRERLPEDPPEEYPGEDCTAALALARIARVDAPIVLAVDRFESVDAAAAWLDAPVLRAASPEIQTR